jgi:EXPERA (EXPanded EBP superfamily)
MASISPPPFTLDGGTLFSLAVAFSLMPAAQALAAAALPKSVSTKYKILFLWHAYDFLTHFIIEGSFLYHCFFSYIELPLQAIDYPHPASLTAEGVYFLAQKDRRYGPIYSQSPMARLWQEYAKADHRWGGADLTVIALELLTVGLAGPAAMYICYLLAKVTNSREGKSKVLLEARMWFVATILATGELYGGFMTFAPEWLSGNTQLAGDDPVYLWLYLVFFNMLWVFVPFWILWESYHKFTAVFASTASSSGSKKTR